MDDTSIRKPPAHADLSTGKGEKIAKIGSLVSAIMASSCCWLPLVLLGVGVSGAGIAAALDAYRPLFMVFTFSFLGAAFYLTYRPKKTGFDGMVRSIRMRLTATSIGEILRSRSWFRASEREGDAG